MKLVVISSAPIVQMNGKNYMYAPYHKEMKIWAKHVDQIQFCCPIWKNDKNLLIDEIEFSIEPILVLKEFDITRLSNFPKAILYSIINLWILFKAMRNADHIHLRCPGNMTLLAALVQILFPSKPKTAKYAGNWDPKAQQPITYKIQRWILSNTFLTKNIQVLVYGDWPNQSKNIKSFFTATYSESEIQNSEFRIQKNDIEGTIRFLFVGTLSPGKQPIYAIQLVEALHKKGFSVQLDIYGDGVLRNEVSKYCIENKLENIVFLKGNQSKDTVLQAYQGSHFLLLPSKSEGWPKVVAEAMVWGCVPVVLPVSCVSYMLHNGERGLLLKQSLTQDVLQVEAVLFNPSAYLEMNRKAQAWSRQFTTDAFEVEIQKLLR